MPPKKSVNAVAPKRGRPSKASLAAKEKAKKEEQIEVESEEDQSLGYPAMPPPSGRQVKIAAAKQSNKRERQVSSDEDEVEEVQPRKQPKKAAKKTIVIDMCSEEGSGEELSLNTKATLGTPISLEKNFKVEEDALELFSSSREGKKERVKFIKPIDFLLPSPLEGEDAESDKRNKGKGKVAVDKKVYLDLLVGEVEEEDGMDEEADDEEEEEEEDTQELVEKVKADLATISTFLQNVREGGEKRDVFGPFTDKKAVYMEDMERMSLSTSDPSPAEDEVLDRSRQDKCLVQSYKGMGSRSQRTILARMDDVGTDSLPISVFFNKEMYPDINKEFTISLVTFSKYKRCYNLSRVELQHLTHLGGQTAKSNSILIATVDKCTELGLALSVVVVNESCLFTPQVWSNNKVCKLFTGKPLSQEDTLLESGIVMALGLGLPEVKQPVNAGWFTFSCRPMDADAQFSPSKPRATNTWDIKFSIGSESHLVVLDGRKKTFGLNDDLLKLSNLLPPFTSEIPFGFLVLVGYVPSLYTSNNGSRTLGFSFSWVVVLATPRVPQMVASKSKASKGVKTSKGSSSKI